MSIDHATSDPTEIWGTAAATPGPGDDPAAALVEAIRRVGNAVTEDARLCQGVLADFGVTSRIADALAAAVADGAVAELTKPHPGQALDTLIGRLARGMQDRRAIDPAMAQWAVSTWARALGVDRPAAPSLAPTPGPGSDATVVGGGAVGPSGGSGGGPGGPGAPTDLWAIPGGPFVPTPPPERNRTALVASLAGAGLLLVLVVVALAWPHPGPGPGPNPPPPSTTSSTTPPPAHPGALGIQVDDGPNGGAIITRFNSSTGPAARAGFLIGDEITEINSRNVDGAQDFLDRIHAMPAGSSVRLTFLRDDQVFQRTVVLAESTS